jgi:hypothetical protein
MRRGEPVQQEVAVTSLILVLVPLNLCKRECAPASRTLFQGRKIGGIDVSMYVHTIHTFELTRLCPLLVSSLKIDKVVNPLETVRLLFEMLAV